jgi:hypothetical protein
MQNLLKLMASAIAFVLILSMYSCGEQPGSNVKGIEGSIPSNASAVMLLNTGQLMEKADFDALKKTSFYKEMLVELEKESPEAIEFFTDPTSAGIALSSNMGFYASLSENYAETKAVDVAFIFPVGNKDKIAETLENMMKDKPELKLQEMDGYNMIALKNNTKLIHNDKILAFVSFEDAAKINNILNSTGENIKSNENFNKHFKEGKDVMFWMHADHIIAMSLKESGQEAKIKGGLGMAQISEDVLKDNYMSFYYDFQKGEIDAGASFDFCDALKAEFGDFLPGELAVDYSNYIPSENLALAFSFGINPEGILEFVKKRKFDKMADQNLAMAGMDLEKIKNGITGGMALGVYAPESDDADPAVVFALGLKDKAFMTDIVDKFGMLGGFVKDGDKYVKTGSPSMDDPDEAPQKVIISIQDDVLLLSNSAELIDKAIAGGKNPVMAELQDGWMGAYMNYALLEEHHDNFTSMAPLDPSHLAISKMLHEYNEIADFKVLMKGEHIDIKTDLKNKDVNSLKRLIQVADEIYKNKEKIQTEIEKHMEEEKDDFEGFEEEFEEEENT